MIDRMDVIERGELTVVGLAVRTSNAEESDPARARLARLWQRASAPGAFAHVPGRLDENLYAVLTDYESDHHGAYTQVVGVAVRAVPKLPEGMVAVRVPSGPSLKIEVRGPMPGALIETWQQIWKQTEAGAQPPRSFRTDLEVHHGDGAEIYLSV